MMRRILLGVVAAAATAGLFALASPVSAVTQNCKGGNCPNDAGCSGDYYSQSGCGVQCYNGTTNPGQIEPAGSADCGPTTIME
jgi:hypothetical protein